MNTECQQHPPRIALLACSVFEKEIALYSANAAHIVESRWFEIGLHDQPDRLRATLQAELSAVEARQDLDAVVLAYGLCGRGTAGLRPLRHKLVLARVHDCIAIFMGSKESYDDHQRRCPNCYYYTPGWNRKRRVPGPEKLKLLRSELAQKFDPDDVEFLLTTEREQWAMHDTATYLDLGTNDAQSEANYAWDCAAWLGWKFERLHGNPRLLRDLLWGNWDVARFLIVEPGLEVVHSPDENIVRAAAISSLGT